MGFVSGFQSLDTIVSYAGAVAAIFAILNYLKMHQPALKSYIEKEGGITNGIPTSAMVTSINVTNNAFNRIHMKISVAYGEIKIKEYSGKIALCPQGEIHHRINYLDDLYKLGVLDKTTNQKVNKNSDDYISISVYYTYRPFLLKKTVLSYSYWNDENQWWAIGFPLNRTERILDVLKSKFQRKK
jgi:hypothetical protein